MQPRINATLILNPNERNNMRTPIRYQSCLPIRRSYKPARRFRRALDVTFRPGDPVTVPIARTPGPAVAVARNPAELTRSG